MIHENNQNNPLYDTVENIKNIPMPDEDINSTDDKNRKKTNVSSSSAISRFIGNIHIDDLLIIAVILLLFNDRTKDELLIIILVYLFLA